jgi:hypothetical protein
LGFSTLWADDGWHFLIRDSVKIMIGECPDEQPASEIGDHSYFAYFEIESIDDLYSEYVSNKVEFLSSIQNKPWGQREFFIKNNRRTSNYFWRGNHFSNLRAPGGQF